jgi:cytidylate kinase
MAALAQPSQYKYRNIVISGLPGSGSTTLLRLLKDKLGLEGWRGFSGGEFMRAYALEKGIFKENQGMHHDSRHYEDDFDRQIDMGMREKLASENQWIIESWLAGFLGQEIPGVLKILVDCSDDAIRVDRVVNRDGLGVQEAKDNMRERYEANLSKWSRMYSDEWQEWVVKPGTLGKNDPINFWRPELYDVVLDTYSLSQEETLQAALNALSGE